LHPFVFHADVEARAIFQKLDPRFEPRISFVGIPIDPKEKIGVGPQGTPFRADDFTGVPARAEKLEQEDPESQSRWMPDPTHGWTEAHEELQKSKERKIRCRALCRALTEAANSAPGSSGYATYCGWPVPYDGKEVTLILQLQRDIHDSYHHLRRGSYRDGGGFHEYRRERSLIDAVAAEYLAETTTELANGRPGAGLHNIKDQENLLLRAAKRLMFTPAVAGGNEDGLHGLFDACNNLSTLKYEGKEGIGRVIFARPGHPQVQQDLMLKRPVPLRSVGAVRKLLQMASGHLALLCDSYEVYGLGRVLSSYDLSTEDVFTVQFLKQFAWALLHGDHPLMQVRYGEPSIRVPGFSKDRFRQDLPRVFPGISTDAVEGLCAIASAIDLQRHGCMLVISCAAKEEAERLNAQCIPVQPFPLSTDVIPLVTAIDGSVLVDLQGNCHAIGVILDGMASAKCSSERGARYNSAVRYVYGRKDAMAVVKSEDGMLDIFPELRPQIRRSEIRQHMDALRLIASQDTFDGEALGNVVQWLEDHEFYLTPMECDEANRLHEEAQRKKPNDVMYAFRQRPITPHPDMDDSYYFPE
jgi:DisA bacterial checkpoint controller nucleotide-binding